MAMRIENGKFKNRIQDGIDDSFMRGAVAKAQNNLLDRRLQVADELGNWEEWRENSEQIRIHTLEFLDYYLMQLSENVTKRGGHVFFAKTKEDASKYIQEVIKKKEATKIVKSKSMVTEEISLNQALEEIGCEILETDLGEYILQLDDHNPPSHIVTPALHLNKEQIRDVFVEKLGYTGTTDPYEMAKFIRAILRKKFMEAEVGITGCNFAVANTGSISLVTNEGNAELSTMMPKTHIAVMGMERVVPTLEELEVLVGMLCRSAVGQTLTSYISVLTGPKEFGDVDGPEDFHLVIVDNGRSEILGTEFQSILQCIRCGACINVCPVYRHIGGHSYGSIYPGPIGAVLSPLLGGYDDFKELPFASSLCGACTDACPVKIPLHNLLVEHRKVIVEKVGSSPIHEKVTMKAINKVISSPKLYKSATKYASVASIPFKKDDSIQRGVGLLKGWTDIRNFPAPEKERLRDWFEKRKRREEK